MDRIRELREDHDLKQKDVAKYLHVSQVAYSYYEIGKRQIPLDLLKKLADYYDTSIDYIVYRTDVRKSYPKSHVVQ